jgi:hypothetical protein
MNVGSAHPTDFHLCSVRYAVANAPYGATLDQASIVVYACGAPLPKYESGYLLTSDTRESRGTWVKLDDAQTLELWNQLHGTV